MTELHRNILASVLSSCLLFRRKTYTVLSTLVFPKYLGQWQTRHQAWGGLPDMILRNDSLEAWLASVVPYAAALLYTMSISNTHI